MKYTISKIPEGMAGTDATVAEMSRLVHDGLRDPNIRFTALDIINQAGVRERDWQGEIAAVFEWVCNNIRYTRDPYELETLHSPAAILELRSGDCDDQSIILAALLQALGHKTRFKVISSRNPKAMNHVYIEVFLKGQWTPLDATNPDPMIGWESPVILNSKTYGGEMYYDENEDMQGLGAAVAAGQKTLVIPGEQLMPHITATLRADMKQVLEKRAVDKAELVAQLNYLSSPLAQKELSPVQIQPAITVISEAIRVIDNTPGYSKQYSMSGLAGLDDLGWNLFKALKKSVGSAVKLAAGFIPGVGPLVQAAISAISKPKPGPGQAAAAPAPTIQIANPPQSPADAPTVKLAPTGGGFLSNINPLYIGLAIAGVGAALILPKLMSRGGGRHR